RDSAMAICRPSAVRTPLQFLQRPRADPGRKVRLLGTTISIRLLPLKRMAFSTAPGKDPQSATTSLRSSSAIMSKKPIGFSTTNMLKLDTNLNVFSKFVDSHLRPYRCKVESCAEARFSSTACLLRHEREAHRM